MLVTFMHFLQEHANIEAAKKDQEECARQAQEEQMIFAIIVHQLVHARVIRSEILSAQVVWGS